MKIGMLWFDNNKSEKLEEKILHAVKYYKNKYGASPTLCYVNPCMLPKELSERTKSVNAKDDLEIETVVYNGDNIEIRISQAVLPYHFWIGVNGVGKQQVSKSSPV